MFRAQRRPSMFGRFALHSVNLLRNTEIVTEVARRAEGYSTTAGVDVGWVRELPIVLARVSSPTFHRQPRATPAKRTPAGRQQAPRSSGACKTPAPKPLWLAAIL